MTHLAPDGLIERASELHELRAALRDGDGVRLLVLEGPAGIGKTRLLGALSAEAPAATRVLTARAGELERDLPFGVVRQLLEPALAGAGPQASARLLDGAAALAQPALAPSPPPTTAGGFGVLHGLYWLTANLAAQQRLLLCVDDLHWADEASLRCLAYLGARLDGVDAQLCVTLRPHEPGTDPALIAAVTGGGRSRVVRPAPLSLEGAAAFVGARLGGEPAAPFAAACREATGGNPLLLEELVRALQDEGVRPDATGVESVRAAVPGGLAAATLRRVQRVAPEATGVARAVALLGDDADADGVAALSGCARAVVSSALEGMARAGVLGAARPPAFTHPLVRAAIAADIPAQERAQLRLRAARLLHGGGARPERVAMHLLEAPAAGDPWVVEVLREGAREAAARGALPVAGALLRRALDEPVAEADAAAVLLEAGAAEAQAGDARGIQHLRRAIAVARDPVQRAEACLALVRVLAVAGELRAGVAHLDEILNDPQTPEDLRIRADVELVELARLDITLRPRALERLADLQRLPLDGHPLAPVVLANLATESLARGDAVPEVCVLAERALAGDRLLDAPMQFGLAANAIMICGRYGHALAAWDGFVSSARARGDVPAYAVGLAFRAAVHWRSGSLSAAIADAEASLEAGPAHGFDLPAGFAAAFLAEARLLRGELPAARDALARVRTGGDQLQDTLLRAARGHLRLAEDRPREALDDLLAVGRAIGEWATTGAMVPWRSGAAAALAALGRGEEAAALLAEELVQARAFGDPWLLGQALRTAALVGPEAARPAALAEAVEVHRASEARFELARTLAALGTAQRRAGATADARTTLREAMDLAAACGAPAVAEQIRADLVAAGGRPRRSAHSGPAALTPTEERVARMAAEGPTNRQIAQALFVTEKTVEAHLGAVYRKLGIHTRAELPARLAATTAAAPGRRRDA